jgi:hypothetical protein
VLVVEDSSLINYLFCLENRTVLFESRGAWRILAESGFCGGNAEQTALRADHISSPVLNSEFLRCFLIDVRTFFDENPEN